MPEFAEKYPEATMFGLLPAWGFYGRHVEGLTLRNVRVHWQQPDARPALIFDDVAGLELDGFKTDTPVGGPVVWLNQVRGALIRGGLAEKLVRTTKSKAVKLAY